MGFTRVVWVSATAALVARFPSLLWPLRPDEAGFLMVARTWHPAADSVYGHHWVDRPPPIIALLKLTDWAGGPYAHRLVGAIGCVVLVVAAAGATRELARRMGVVDDHERQRLAGWVAVATAAMVGNAQIDAVAAKGELFGLPLVMGSCWLALRAVRRVSAADAFWAGLLAMLAIGMKQSIVGGLVFGGVLLVGSLVARQLSRAAALRCAGAAVAGALVPVLVVVGWAVVVGVRLQELWYVTVGFRSDANAVIASQQSDGPTSRILTLVLVFVGAGMLFVTLWFVARLPALLRRDAVAVLAVLAMLAVDLVGVAVSGSFWTPYLFVPVAPCALALAALVAHDRLAPVRRRPSALLVAFAVASSVFSLVGWSGAWVHGRVPVEARTGEAIAAASSPGDDVIVYGGRADIQWSAGMRSPYPYLWSLPMRTLDPDLDELRSVLTGRDAPAWVVEATAINAWSEIGTKPIEDHMLARYDYVAAACGRYRIYHLNTTEPVEVDVDCTTPYRTIWGR
ncbi:hypothetical protein [Nocardioides exalbidus]|nr:hypothetical protein [Nocardioides exalbidus]